MSDDVIKKALDESYELGVKHCIKIIIDIFTSTDRPDPTQIITQMKSLLTNPHEQPKEETSLIKTNKPENT